MDSLWLTLQVLKMLSFSVLSTIVYFCRDPKTLLWVLQIGLLGITTMDAVQARYLSRFNLVRRGF